MIISPSSSCPGRSVFLISAARLVVAVAVFFLAVPAKAAVVVIDIGATGFNISGTNASLAPGTDKTLSDFPVSGSGGGSMYFGNLADEIGFTGYAGMSFATGLGDATPTKLGGNQVIDGSLNYVSGFNTSEFLYQSAVSPDFGPGSYMAFKTADYFGYLEVTWDSNTQVFEILSGAYEDVAGVSITTPVPEPSAAALLGVTGLLFVLGRRRV